MKRLNQIQAYFREKQLEEENLSKLTRDFNQTSASANRNSRFSWKDTSLFVNSESSKHKIVKLLYKYLHARFSACTRSNSLSIWAKRDHSLERSSGGKELSRSWSKPSCRILSDPILFGERVRRMDSRLAFIFMLPACCLLISREQAGEDTKQMYSCSNYKE